MKYILMEGIDEGPEKVEILSAVTDEEALLFLADRVNEEYEGESYTINTVRSRHNPDYYPDEIGFVGGDGDSAPWFSLFKVKDPA